jgi:hypothetical protein
MLPAHAGLLRRLAVVNGILVVVPARAIWQAIGLTVIF